VAQGFLHPPERTLAALQLRFRSPPELLATNRQRNIRFFHWLVSFATGRRCTRAGRGFPTMRRYTTAVGTAPGMTTSSPSQRSTWRLHVSEGQMHWCCRVDPTKIGRAVVTASNELVHLKLAPKRHLWQRAQACKLMTAPEPTLGLVSCTLLTRSVLGRSRRVAYCHGSCQCQRQ